MKVSKEIKDSAVDYSMKCITHICETIGPRESGMPAELECQKFIQNELEKNNWVDSTAIEPFKMSRYGLLSFAPVIGFLMVTAGLIQVIAHAVGNNIFSMVADIIFILFSASSLAIAFIQFFLYKPFLDIFLPKLQSHNLIAKINPTGEVKRRIVICGHADSAYEFTFMKIHQSLMVVVVATNIVCLFIGVAISIFNLVTKPATPHLWSLIIFAIMSVIFVSFFFLFNFKEVVPGANDNLTGVLVAVSAARCMKEANIQLENTEVQLLITGSEEAGLRGANAWAKKYQPIYSEEGIDTVVVAFDTMHDYEWMSIYEKEMSGITKNSARAVKLIDRATEEMGVKLPHSTVPVGASDAAAISLNKMHAVCIAAQNPNGTRYYHNRRDNQHDLKPETFAYGLDIALKTIEVFDKEGLPEV
ncbi:MAG TPA: M20/M25/M40 family metallo-hydrolase [Clostridia bacterium]|jgi:hypothetical protein|nr:M20/M25/M40 family metallo-hydrolase [Clostridia bacterium]